MPVQEGGAERRGAEESSAPSEAPVAVQEGADGGGAEGALKKALKGASVWTAREPRCISLTSIRESQRVL